MGPGTNGERFELELDRSDRVHRRDRTVTEPHRPRRIASTVAGVFIIGLLSAGVIAAWQQSSDGTGKPPVPPATVPVATDPDDDPGTDLDDPGLLFQLARQDGSVGSIEAAVVHAALDRLTSQTPLSYRVYTRSPRGEHTASVSAEPSTRRFAWSVDNESYTLVDQHAGVVVEAPDHDGVGQPVGFTSWSSPIEGLGLRSFLDDIGRGPLHRDVDVNVRLTLGGRWVTVDPVEGRSISGSRAVVAIASDDMPAWTDLWFQPTDDDVFPERVQTFDLLIDDGGHLVLAQTSVTVQQADGSELERLIAVVYTDEYPTFDLDLVRTAIGEDDLFAFDIPAPLDAPTAFTAADAFTVDFLSPQSEVRVQETGGEQMTIEIENEGVLTRTISRLSSGTTETIFNLADGVAAWREIDLGGIDLAGEWFVYSVDTSGGGHPGQLLRDGPLLLTPFEVVDHAAASWRGSDGDLFTVAVDGAAVARWIDRLTGWPPGRVIGSQELQFFVDDSGRVRYLFGDVVHGDTIQRLAITYDHPTQPVVIDWPETNESHAS